MGDDYDEDYWDQYWAQFDETTKDREYGLLDILTWSIFPVAILGLACSLTTLVFLALFPKPLKTTVIHCIILCVSSILTCAISISQASTWEVSEDMAAKGKSLESGIALIDFAVSWITILVIGISNWLFVAFCLVRLNAISRVNINRYENYVTASSDNVNATPQTSACYVLRTVLVVLFFGYLLPTAILPVIALVEYYHNWLPDEKKIWDVLKFAFEYPFLNRWGSVLFLLVPISFTVILSGIILVQMARKLRGLKLMRTQWDKAKLTLGAVLIFLGSRIPMLVYAFFAFRAYPPEPHKQDDDVKKNLMGPTAPICLIVACLGAALNLPLFYISSRRFKALVCDSRGACRDCRDCRINPEQETSYSFNPNDTGLSVPPQHRMSPSTASSSLPSSTPLKSADPRFPQGNFFFNPAHLDALDYNHSNNNVNGIKSANGHLHS